MKKILLFIAIASVAACTKELPPLEVSPESVELHVGETAKISVNRDNYEVRLSSTWRDVIDVENGNTLLAKKINRVISPNASCAVFVDGEYDPVARVGIKVLPKYDLFPELNVKAPNDVLGCELIHYLGMDKVFIQNAFGLKYQTIKDSSGNMMRYDNWNSNVYRLGFILNSSDIVTQIVFFTKFDKTLETLPNYLMERFVQDNEGDVYNLHGYKGEKITWSIYSLDYFFVSMKL